MSMFGPKQNKGLWLALFFGVGTFLMVAYVIFQSVVPSDVGTFGDISVATNPIEAGSLQSYTAKECDKGNYKSVDIRQTIVSLSNPPEITLPVAGRYVTQNLLCTNIIIIPGETPQGQYRLQISVSYRVNPFQSVDKVYYSEPFVITNKDKEYNILKAPEQQQFQNDKSGKINRTVPTQNLTTAGTSPASSTTPTGTTKPTTPTTPPAMTIPQGPVNKTINDILNGTTKGLQDITKPVLCNPLLSISC